MIDFYTLIDIAAKVVAAAAAIAAVTPTPKDDSALAFVRKILDLLALNVFNAKNK